MLKKKSTRDMVVDSGHRRESFSERDTRTAPQPYREQDYDLQDEIPHGDARIPEQWVRKYAPEEAEPLAQPTKRLVSERHPQKFLHNVEYGSQREMPANKEIKLPKERPVKKERTIRNKKQVRENRPVPTVLKSRAFWGAACLLLAFIIAFVIIPLVENSIVQKTSVVVAAQNIPEGTKIENSMLVIKEFSKFNLPADVIFNLDDAVGKYAEVDLISGDMLTFTKAVSTYSEDSYLYNLPDGKMAMSVELAELEQSVSGKLRGGDVVRIYAVYKSNTSDSVDSSNYSAYLINELQYVEVLAVTNSDVQDIKSSGEQAIENTDGENADGKKSIATVTLLVNNRQAEVLAGLNSNATLYSALVVRGDDEKKKAALNTQDNFFISEETAKETATKGENENNEDNSIVG